MRTSAGMLLLAGTLLFEACEPDTITEARDQLGRGPERIAQLTVPIVVDTISVDQLFSDTTAFDTLPDGLVAVRVDADTINVSVGNDLKFKNVNFDQFVFSFDQMLTTAEVTTSVTAPGPPPGLPPSAASGVSFFMVPADTVRFNTNQGSSVRGASIQSGFVVRLLSNSTNCDANVTLVVSDSIGGAVANFPMVTVTQGSTILDSADASGSTISRFVVINPNVDFGGCTPSGGTVRSDLTFRPMALASVALTNVSESFNETYNALQSESRLQAVDTVDVASGFLDITVQNRLPIPVTVDLVLNGVTRAGVTLTDMLTVPSAPGDGTTVNGLTRIDLAGTRILPSVTIAEASGLAQAGNVTVTPAVAVDAVTVDANGEINVQRLAGTLDPAQTPELTVSVEDFQEIQRSDFNLGDLEDPVKESSINTAPATFTLSNKSNIPLKLVNIQLGAALLDASGQPTRDSLGSIVFERGTSGPVLVSLRDVNSDTIALSRLGFDTVTANIAPVLDLIVKSVLNGRRMAMVATGNAVAGDGTSSSITNIDAIDLAIDAVIGLDFTVPDTGVVFNKLNRLAGADLGLQDADNLAIRIVEASAVATVENRTPFAVRLEIALIAGDQPDGIDVFTLPGNVPLTPITIAAPQVDSTGNVLTPATGEVTLALTGENSRILLGSRFTAGIRVFLLPGKGASGRGRIGSTDRIVLNATARLQVMGGGK